MSFITDLEPLIQQSSMFVDKANGIKLMSEYVICVFKGPLNVLSPFCACLHMCAITRASTPAFHCTRSCMCVFINIANGFSAGPTFVCSVTRPGSRFIRRAFRAEAWARAVNELTPVSGRRGQKGETPGRVDDRFSIKARWYSDPETWKRGWMEFLSAGNWKGKRNGDQCDDGVNTQSTKLMWITEKDVSGVTGELSVLSVMTPVGWSAGFGSGLRVFRCGICIFSQLDSLGIPVSFHRPKAWTWGWVDMNMRMRGDPSQWRIYPRRIPAFSTS